MCDPQIYYRIILEEMFTHIFTLTDNQQAGRTLQNMRRSFAMFKNGTKNEAISNKVPKFNFARALRCIILSIIYLCLPDSLE